MNRVSCRRARDVVLEGQTRASGPSRSVVATGASRLVDTPQGQTRPGAKQPGTGDEGVAEVAGAQSNALLKVMDGGSDDPARASLGGNVAALLREVAAQLMGESDEIASTMIRAYEAEIPAYGGISDEALKEDVRSVSAALVRSWLTIMSTGEPLGPGLLQPMVEGLRRRRCVGVARAAPWLSLLELEQTGQLLEEQVDAVLWTIRHESVIAALPWPRELDRCRLRRRFGRLVNESRIAAVGLGGQAEGANETRASYAEAIAALRFGPLVATAPSPVYDHQDLAPLIALLDQPDRARRFAQSTLEPLGELASRTWLLPTLEAYLIHQGRLKEAAADLDVHVNTVKYRLKERRAHAGLAFADGDRAIALLLALRALRVLEADAGAPASHRPEEGTS